MIIEFATSPLTEFLAVLSFLIYVVLCAKGSIWCWAPGFVASFLYTFIVLGAHLPVQVTLQILYMIMAIWGWSQWFEDKKPDGVSVYTYLDVQQHLFFIPVLALFSAVLPLLLANAFHPTFPWLDAIAMMFGLYATVLTIYRKIESWLFWILLNLITFFIYAEEDLLQTAVVSLGNVALSAWGFYNWRQFRASDAKVVDEPG